MPINKDTLPKQDGVLPKHLEEFCQARHEGMTQEQAAVKAGRSKRAGSYFDKMPAVQQRIAELRKLYAEKLLDKRTDKAIKEITIDRNDIIMGLADIAQKGESERARVAAWLGLADIFMLRAKNTREIKDFYGWTAEELRDYAISGTVPARFGLLAGTGPGAALGGTNSLRTDKSGVD